MAVFELIVGLLLVSVLLALFARRLGIPYPTLLAFGGAALALTRNAPALELDPTLALALFVAPVLIDSGFDTSLRDLRDNWRGVASLVVIAVGITTAVTAGVVHYLVPAMPWACAIALGAIVAPPDAAAATAVLKQVTPPHRILTLLEGESLLNDATALLIYRVAVGAAIAGTFSWSDALPVFSLGVVGSLIAGPAMAFVITRLLRLIPDAPSAVVMQFVGGFCVWIAAERMHLSGVLTTVTFAMSASLMAEDVPARMRVPSFAVWETAVFVLNVLAFVLVGLQLGPILSRLPHDVRLDYFWIAGAVLAAVILTRLALVMTTNAVGVWICRRFDCSPARTAEMVPTSGGSMIVSWCGMRGIVTLAAAYALPAAMPYRDLIVLCAFAVVFGTLVVQGLTLPVLLRVLNVRDNDPVGQEIRHARVAAYEAALKSLDDEGAPLTAVLRQELQALLKQARGEPASGVTLDELRRKASTAARKAVLDLRHDAVIGDAAYHKLEEELDWAELGAERRL